MLSIDQWKYIDLGLRPLSIYHHRMYNKHHHYLFILSYPVAHRWQNMVLAIRLLFKVEYCFTITTTMALHTIYYLKRPPTLFNRTTIIYTTTCVTKIKYIVCIVLKLIALIIITLFARLYGRVGNLNTCGKHDRIISIRGDVSAHQSSLTRPLSNEVLAPSE